MFFVYSYAKPLQLLQSRMLTHAGFMKCLRKIFIPRQINPIMLPTIKLTQNFVRGLGLRSRYGLWFRSKVAEW